MVRQNSQLKEWNKYDIIEMNRWFYPNIEYNKLTYAIKLPASIIFLYIRENPGVDYV